MIIDEALKETGKATYPMWGKDEYVHIVHSEFIDQDGNPYYCSHLLDNSWESYPLVEEIRPEVEGELWFSEKHNDYVHTVWKNTTHTELMTIAITDEETFEGIIHNQNGWTRIHPPVEEILPDEEFDDDDLLKELGLEGKDGIAVEEIIIEDVIWHKDGYIIPDDVNSNFKWEDLLNLPSMTMILKIPKE